MTILSADTFSMCLLPSGMYSDLCVVRYQKLCTAAIGTSDGEPPTEHANEYVHER